MALHLSPDTLLKVRRWTPPSGATTRINHDDCSAGADTRRRLYITNDPHGLLLFCHNCGEGTKLPHGGVRVRTPPSSSSTISHASAYTGTPMPYAEPPLMRLWLRAWGITPSDEFWIKTVKDEEGIVFPFTGGHQIRWLKNNPLKWQTYGDPQFNVTGDNILICEDALSMKKWLQADPTNGGICMFGAKASKVDPCMIDASKNYLVWLDNDQKKIDEIAADTAKRLGFNLSANTVLVKGGTDPKRYTMKELLNVRDEARKLCRSSPPDGQPYHTLEVQIPDQRVRAGLGVKRNPS